MGMNWHQQWKEIFCWGTTATWENLVHTQHFGEWAPRSNCWWHRFWLYRDDDKSDEWVWRLEMVFSPCNVYQYDNQTHIGNSKKNEHFLSASHGKKRSMMTCWNLSSANVLAPQNHWACGLEIKPPQMLQLIVWIISSLKFSFKFMELGKFSRKHCFNRTLDSMIQSI